MSILSSSPSTERIGAGSALLQSNSPSIIEPKLVYWSCSTLLRHSEALKQLGIKLIGVDYGDTATVGALVQPLLPLSQIPITTTNR
jgi:hypothetical protein